MGMSELDQRSEGKKAAEDRRLEFIQQLSYEMRTPLDAIIELTSLVMHDPIPRSTRDRIEQIDRAANYLSSIVNDTLDISLFESGRLPLDAREFRMSALLEEIRGMTEPRCSAAGISFTIRTSGNLKERYVGDPRRIRQIVLNLLSQSILMTKRGGEISLDVRELRTGKNTADLSFSVIDNGVGIEEKYLPHIFEAFRDAGSDAAGYDSFGLGLTVASDLAALMGGEIRVDSKRDMGTRFTAEIVLGLADAGTETEAEESSGEEGSVLDIDFGNRRILVVEDNPINADITKDLLQLQGFQVEYAPDGEKAVEFVRNAEPGTLDAILMDIRMPVMDGLEAVRRIRELPVVYARSIPIIAMSANAYEEDVEKSIEAGMNVHLSKPVDPQKLFGVLAGIFGIR